MERFFSEKPKRAASQNNSSPELSTERDEETAAAGEEAKAGARAVPKGVVLGKDGKPCRTCTPFADWLAMTKAQNPPSSSSSPPSTTTTTTTTTSPHSSSTPPSSPSTPPPSCPPDISLLGNHSWTLLHSISASYPSVASAGQQSEMRQFLALFAKLYPCWVCGDDFRHWMAQKGNEPRVAGREGLGRWMCEAHNEVNRKTGKKEFDCGKWEERWRTGGEGCG